ncbi:MAG TPA: amidohydrolase family protein [Stellaceae bacterium]|nr:amidohydrolase family protein [Stellaceae bacterium]
MTEHQGADASRRQFLTGLAAASAAAVATSPLPSFAQAGAAPAAKPAKPKHHGVIDTHHHFWAPEYLKAQDDWGKAHHVPPFPAMEKWTPEVSLAEMDKSGVQTAVLSLASISDGFWGLDAQNADRVVRASIDYAQKMMSDHKGRFGLFAPLAMIDTDTALKEIGYALDQAHADGIGLQSSYNGVLPGDPVNNPVWEELNRRKAVVYFHGPNPACCSAIKTGPAVNPSVVEVTFDITRAALSLLVNGTLVRYPDINWVLSYGGGTLPYVAGRIAAFVNGSMRFQGVKPQEIAPEGVLAAFGKLYYDTVNVTEEPSWKALTDLVKPTQIVYGTDFLYYNDSQLDNIDKRVSSPTEKAMILSGNAKRLVPRLAKT